MVRYKPPIDSEDYLSYGYDETISAIRSIERRVTAIIADDDRTAFNAMNAIKDLRLVIPRDISLFVICGDLSMMNRASPPLTGMDLQPSELGANAVRLLMQRIGAADGDMPDNLIIGSNIIERDSCATLS